MIDQQQSPPDPLPAPAAYRWFGLAAFVGGLAVFDQWGVSSWRDWYPSRFAFLVAMIGGAVYLEGLAAKVIAAVRRHRSS